MTNIRNRIISIIFLTFTSTAIFMASAEKKIVSRVIMQYEKTSDGGIKVISVYNGKEKKITVNLDGVTETVESQKKISLNKYARNVSFDSSLGNGDLWTFNPPIKEETESASPSEDYRVNSSLESQVSVNRDPQIIRNKKDIISPATANYAEKINQDPFFGQSAVNGFVQQCELYSIGISAATDKKQFISDHNIPEFLERSKLELDQKKSDLPMMAQEMIDGAKLEDDNSSTINLIIETLNNRLQSREEAYEKLNREVSESDSSPSLKNNLKQRLINYGILAFVIALVILLTIVTISKKNKKRKGQQSQYSPIASPSDDKMAPAIVVRRKTTSILKKQCIDDVVDNPVYMVITASDFVADSAVRNIYIKNSCIREIYNLYAEDLRNMDNPKEDGCMVLGRWVLDSESQKYDISLEEVVFPGDDAVFKEYELNFGGKIKLRIIERLRKLRKDTNLQYDLVCWIHSHPGLGVFFSNSDNDVQLQLKHTQHPNFLIAFVVDILTPDQELGIFTFRKDGSMNSKGDITKMYSLEDMYKWAVESDKKTFTPDSYYDILGNAKIKLPSCRGIEMNNSSIIDLTQIVIEPEIGIVGWAEGSAIEIESGQGFVVSSIVKDLEKPVAGIIGCLVNVRNLSLPTIQRLIARDCSDISFVMVYSSKQMNLTTIPVINGELLTDEQFYGDVNIEELKIWTRRKR